MKGVEAAEALHLLEEEAGAPLQVYQARKKPLEEGAGADTPSDPHYLTDLHSVSKKELSSD